MDIGEKIELVCTEKSSVSIMNGSIQNTIYYDVLEHPGFIDGPRQILMSEFLFLEFVRELDRFRWESVAGV